MSALLAAEDGPEQDADTVLALRAGHGDRAAFAELIEGNYDLIYRIAAKWCGNTTEAEDVAQDVCIKLSTALKSFDARARFSSWLYRVVLNAVRDRQRQRAREARRDTDFSRSANVFVGDEAETATSARDLWQAVQALPDKLRDAVLLVYSEELSHAEAALVMDVKETTISWYVHEARKALKGVLE